jgi:hypothetical protein
MHDLHLYVPYFLNLYPGQEGSYTGLPDCQVRNRTPGNPHFIYTLRLLSSTDHHYS